MTSTISLGDQARVASLHLDSSYAPETPTAVTVVIEAPDGTTTTVNSPASGLTLGQTFPESLRADLLRGVKKWATISDSTISDGTGCVEYLHTPTSYGVWEYSIKPTAPSVSARTVRITVTEQFL